MKRGGKMKIKLLLLIALSFASALTAADVSWVGPITFNPANPAVGDNVRIQVRFSVMKGTVENLNVMGTVDGDMIYSKTFVKITGPKSTGITVNWKAAHYTKIMRQQGQPSNIKVVFSFTQAGIHPSPDQTIEATIPVSDPAPGTGGNQNITQQQPNLVLDPCFENADGNTDLVPLEFSFKSIGSNKFSYKIVYKNIGPRCLKSVFLKITYPYNGVDTIYKQFLHLPQDGLWAIKAGETKTQTGTFQRTEIPDQAYSKYIDSEAQEITYKITFKLTLDPNSEIQETDESNNVILKNHSWVED